jgi:hypothetical protein
MTAMIASMQDDRPVKVLVSDKPLKGRRSFETYADAHVYAVKRARKTGEPVFLTEVYTTSAVMIVAAKPSKG